MSHTDSILDVVEGRTAKIVFTISKDSVPLDLTGLIVTLVMHRGSGALVSPGGTVTVLDQTTDKGKVEYLPVAGDFTWEPTLYTIHQPYELHWKLVDGALAVQHAPSGPPAIVMVHRA